MAEESTLCVNCKREIPSVNFVMHSMHCARNITLCIVCDEPVPRSEMESHQAEFHSLKDCESCGEKMDVSQLNEHKTNFCSMRGVNCSICELELPASEISDHENYCGSRTERCEECGEYVMLRYRKLHVESNHGFLKLDDEPGPTPSWQTNEREAMIGAFSNDLRSHRRAPNYTTLFNAVKAPNFATPSTSKRTNDMPQVNSIPPPHISKFVSKASLIGEMERPRRNYAAVGDHLDSNVARLFSDSLNLARPPLYSKLQSSGSGDLIGEEDLVALPCEFCEALVPANQLILHQTACRPDLARYEEPAAASGLSSAIPAVSSSSIPVKHPGNISVSPGYKIHNNLSTPSSLSSSGTPPHVSRRDFSSSAMDDALLPCEFCHESFSVSKLYEHQTQCTQSWTSGFNERSEPTGTFSGESSSYDPTPLTSIIQSNGGYEANSKKADAGAYKSIRGDELKMNLTGGSRLPADHPRASRKKLHTLLTERTQYAQQRSNNAWPASPFSSSSSTYQASPNLDEFENDEGRQALLKQAQRMGQINAHLGLNKESSSSRRNHLVSSEVPPWVPRARKQPNHHTNPPSSSHNLGPSSMMPSLYSPAGQGGRTTGAIPKQKAGTGKSPITY